MSDQDPRDLERDAQDTAEMFAAFEDICPLVAGNPYIPHWPSPKQALFLGCHPRVDANDGEDPTPPFECLYGGAAGGGKSDALLMAAAQYAWKYPHFRGMLIRRTHAELAMSGALMSRAMEWWIHKGVHWNGDLKKMTFPNGAVVEFGYHDHPTHNSRYQGGNWHFVGFDELTHWPTCDAFDWLMSRIRKGSEDPIPRRLLATANPGERGHVWVKARFVAGRSMYIHATIDDNPGLNREDYKETLRHMHPTRREQLLAGNWDARDPGNYFRAEWFGPLLDPAKDIWPSSDCVRIRWWDLAAGEKVENAKTAGVRMARHRSGVRAIEHCVAFRLTPGARDDRIVQTAQMDGPGVVVGIEIEGGSGGLAQFMALEKRLRAAGFRVVGARPRAELGPRDQDMLIRQQRSENSKTARADPVASCLERGWQRRGGDGSAESTGSRWWGVDATLPVRSQRDGIRLFAGRWTQDYLDVLEGFPDGPTCDEVDATSGAWAWLEAHPAGAATPPPMPKKPAAVQSHDAHPEDRGELPASKWNPWAR